MSALQEGLLKEVNYISVIENITSRHAIHWYASNIPRRGWNIYFQYDGELHDCRNWRQSNDDAWKYVAVCTSTAVIHVDFFNA
jgi:hypothetical protein